MPNLHIIKIGGNIIDHPPSLHTFLENFTKVDELKILVHGGGKIASKLGEQLGLQPNYFNGRRITDDATIDLVTMVYGGLINKQIVARLQALHCNAIGLTGADGNIIPATKRPPKEVDYGWVGDVSNNNLNTSALQLLLNNHLVPVFAPLTHDAQGHILNTNADTIASALSVALAPFYTVRLVYCFEKKGVLENVDDEHSVIPLINTAIYAKLLADNKLFEGILPKLENAFAAIKQGVHQVLIGHADDILLNTSNTTTGTLITH